MSQFKKYLGIVTESRDYLYNEETATIKSMIEDKISGILKKITSPLDYNNPIFKDLNSYLGGVVDSLKDLKKSLKFNSLSQRDSENLNYIDELNSFIETEFTGKLIPTTNDLHSEIRKLIIEIKQLM